MSNRPRIGLGVVLLSPQNQVLLGKRKNAHGEDSWAPPGGHLEFGESFEAGAQRELLEETGLIINQFEFLGVTNDFFEEESKHYISVFMKADCPLNQEIKNLEPHKVENWRWFFLNDLPGNLFLPFKHLISGGAYSVGPSFF